MSAIFFYQIKCTVCRAENLIIKIKCKQTDFPLNGWNGVQGLVAKKLCIILVLIK